MTNNNTHKENDMFHDDFDTQIQCEELFNEAAAWEELEMIDADENEIDEYDEYDEADEDDEDDEDVEFEDNFDSFEETVNQLDDSRDLDFYES